jgi:hypothetical protein
MKSASVCMMAAAAFTTAVVAGPSFAQNYNDPHYAAYAYYQHQCEVEKHNSTMAGVGIGAAVGGLLGAVASHGRPGGTIFGAAAGATVGGTVGHASVHCNGGRPYWAYEQTVEYRGYAGYPGRYPDEWYWHHHCRWVQSERGWMRVCPGPNGYFYPAY